MYSVRIKVDPLNVVADCSIKQTLPLNCASVQYFIWCFEF